MSYNKRNLTYCQQCHFHNHILLSICIQTHLKYTRELSWFYNMVWLCRVYMSPFLRSWWQIIHYQHQKATKLTCSLWKDYCGAILPSAGSTAVGEQCKHALHLYYIIHFSNMRKENVSSNYWLCHSGDSLKQRKATKRKVTEQGWGWFISVSELHRF